MASPLPAGQNHYTRALSLLEAAQGTRSNDAATTLTAQATVSALLAIGAVLLSLQRSLESIADSARNMEPR